MGLFASCHAMTSEQEQADKQLKLDKLLAVMEKYQQKDQDFMTSRVAKLAFPIAIAAGFVGLGYQGYQANILNKQLLSQISGMEQDCAYAAKKGFIRSIMKTFVGWQFFDMGLARAIFSFF